jgi:hypothetical protein
VRRELADLELSREPEDLAGGHGRIVQLPCIAGQR